MPQTSLGTTPRVRGLTSRFAIGLCVLAAVFLGACGDPVVGGSGWLTKGPIAVLHVTGTPYQMGWWQGKLLRSRIRDLHGRWQSSAYAAAAGAQVGERGGAVEQLRKDVLLFTDQSIERLPERARQELAGMSAACEISETELLAMSVMRDGLRIRADTGPRLPGLVAAATGPQAFARLVGTDASLLANEWMIVRREPVGGVATIVVTWPGSLGGIAGVSQSNVGFVSADLEVDIRRRGFGKGLSFDVASRLALEESATAEAFFAKGSSTAGHAIFAVNFAPDADELDAVAMGSVEAYVSIDDRPLYLGERAFIALPPYGRDDREKRDAFFRRMRESKGTGAERFGALWSSVGDAFASQTPSFGIAIGDADGGRGLRCILSDGTVVGYSW